MFLRQDERWDDFEVTPSNHQVEFAVGCEDESAGKNCIVVCHDVSVFNPHTIPYYLYDITLSLSLYHVIMNTMLVMVTSPPFQFGLLH